MSKLHHLYVITRTDGEQYVGVTNDLDRRLYEHQHTNRGNIHLKGESNLKMDIVVSGEREYIYGLETETISKYKAKLNIHPGGCFPHNEPNRAGQKNGRAKFTEEEVIDIRNSHFNGESQTSLAERYGRPKVTISKVVTGDTWKSVSGPISKPSQGKRPDALSEETKTQIKKLRKEGMSGDKVAKLLNIGKTTVYRYEEKL